MRKLAIQLGKLGSALGGLAGLIEISIGAQIRSWIGNKENPFILGLMTFLLSGVAFVSILSASSHVKPSNDRKLAILLGVLLPAAICFTTVGRLWYLPGLLLITTCLLLAYEYWFGKSNDSSPKTILKRFGAIQIIGGVGGLSILVSVVLAFLNSSFGLFQSEILLKAGRFCIEVLPMDIVRSTSLSASAITARDIEVSLVMIVYIFLILGATVALISNLVKSQLFKRIGGILVFAGLVLFIVWLPRILAPTEFPPVRFQSIIASLGLGWYISTVGMSLILITSMFQPKPGDAKS